MVKARGLSRRIGTFNCSDVRFREVTHTHDAAIAALEAVIFLSGEHHHAVTAIARNHHRLRKGYILVAAEILLEFGGQTFTISSIPIFRMVRIILKMRNFSLKIAFRLKISNLAPLRVSVHHTLLIVTV